MNLNDPLAVAILKTYAKHQRFFYLNYFENFKLFVSWLTQEPIGTVTINDSHNADMPWFVSSYELQELAIILKCSQGELYKLCLEIYNEH